MGGYKGTTHLHDHAIMTYCIHPPTLPLLAPNQPCNYVSNVAYYESMLSLCGDNYHTW